MIVARAALTPPRDFEQFHVSLAIYRRVVRITPTTKPTVNTIATTSQIWDHWSLLGNRTYHSGFIEYQEGREGGSTRRRGAGR